MGLLKKEAPKPPVAGVAVVVPNMPPPVDAGCVVVVLLNKPPGAADVPGVDEAPPSENMLDLERASVVELGSKTLLRFAVGSAADGTDVSRFKLPKRLLLPVVPAASLGKNDIAERVRSCCTPLAGKSKARTAGCVPA